MVTIKIKPFKMYSTFKCFQRETKLKLLLNETIITDNDKDVNPFYASLFLYLLKRSENLWFSDVFRGYRKRPAT